MDYLRLKNLIIPVIIYSIMNYQIIEYVWLDKEKS